MLKKFYQFIIYPYTLLLLYLMLFGFGRIDARYPDPTLRLEPVISTVQFTKSGLPWIYIVKIVLGNIIMFIPFGFLGWSFPKLRTLKNLMFNFLSAIIIVEALQYFTRLGIFEVDDIILNTFGVFLGWKIYRYIETHYGRFVTK
ncbi:MULTISPECIES: VanZ family protein [Chryseobacterium]|uniref:Glycopeptide antibiotics resistance protein n=1 Tax=Chryseobacterium camelliae TaxID=1265445 RepID=A0ABU0TMB5_9FLAO|nr:MULTISPECIES: VanZ family protein [Chryseobacterium]MDT3408733.1 glycopeptide antibiotics resistance protein [Pseudacidovorax intermedius]MDQ1097415.1 glycopeptide antibiotics resistance protein [Chryseobacterium camelliae]MDQ1101343.1 glycopeptide antibiotics resistance protein [Chryseobacterium sp. SORGH_AS_1048]MDR6084788.1 glycopeptide antibiotics resistance protein [Chryseobacterium sp. SORGH_AS_0909]MDR6129135.1 glycopeptide antibiotics resistance protein [Chryseobacterium sp. SORGH_A